MQSANIEDNYQFGIGLLYAALTTYTVNVFNMCIKKKRMCNATRSLFRFKIIYDFT